MEKHPKLTPVDKFVKAAFENIERTQLALNVVSSGEEPVVQGLAKSWGVGLSAEDARQIIGMYDKFRRVPIHVATT